MARISRRRLLAAAPLVLPAAVLAARAALAARTRAGATHVYIGTYTHDMGPGGQSDGIYLAEWDAAAGVMSPLRRAVATADPSFLAAHPAGAMLYAVNESETYAQKDGSKGGSVTAFRREAGGALAVRNVVPSGGSDPCHITVDRSGRNVFVANYTSGTVTSFRAGKHGLTGPVAHVALHGHGPNQERQQSAHTHGVALSPDERFLLVNDLGIDRITVFRVDLATAGLTDTGAPYQARPGSGPRHSVFHPNGKWVYCLNEILSTIDTLEWNAQTGELKLLSEARTRDSQFSGATKAAQLLIDRSGRYLYASDRGDDVLVVFRIDATTGALSLLQRIASGGRTPRDFALDPSERWLVVANQDSQNVVVFARDPRTGRLTATGRSYKLGAPVAVLFVEG
jgi:6-phosphogluconolactonase